MNATHTSTHRSFRALSVTPYLMVLTWSVLLGGCATMGGVTHVGGTPERAHVAQAEIPADELLDVWIEIFDPGTLPSDKKKRAGLSMDIREAEARFMPVQLRRTLEQTGYWSAVRVVPRGTEGAELLVGATIVESDGEYLALDVTAEDASGAVLLHRTYDYRIPGADLQRSVLSAPPIAQEPFRPVYEAIANDLARLRSRLSAHDVGKIRELAEIRFAADLAPNAFAAYLEGDAQQGYTVTRLPATDDPMYKRIRAIRTRDAMLVDALSGHVENFHDQMQTPYGQWREARAAEAQALRDVNTRATKRKLLGIGAILAGIGIEIYGGRDARGLGNIAIAGGVIATKSGFDIAQEANIHREAIGELGDSFASEARPLLVDVEGETHELTGSAETQYEQWRELLRRIYASETGFASTAE